MTLEGPQHCLVSWCPQHHIVQKHWVCSPSSACLTGHVLLEVAPLVPPSTIWKYSSTPLFVWKLNNHIHFVTKYLYSYRFYILSYLIKFKHDAKVLLSFIVHQILHIPSISYDQLLLSTTMHGLKTNNKQKNLLHFTLITTHWMKCSLSITPNYKKETEAQRNEEVV